MSEWDWALLRVTRVVYLHSGFALYFPTFQNCHVMFKSCFCGFFPSHIIVTRKSEQRDGGCDSRVWCVESAAWAEFSIIKLPYLAIHSRSCEYVFKWGILDSVPICIVWVMSVALLLKKCICVTEVWFFFFLCVLDMTGFFGRQM